MGRPSKYSPELRERAIRMVFDHAAEHPSQWATIRSVGDKLGISTEALRRWVRQAERDADRRPGLTSDEGAEAAGASRIEVERLAPDEIAAEATRCQKEVTLAAASKTAQLSALTETRLLLWPAISSPLSPPLILLMTVR
jgi:transposase-like protein